MYSFIFEPDISLLTATRTGAWSLDTVALYEAALRLELAQLHLGGRPTAFITDTRFSCVQETQVDDALRTMVAGLGPLNAARTAVVTAAGLILPQGVGAADAGEQVFPSMALARNWATTEPAAEPVTVHDEPIDAAAAGPAVHLHGLPDVNVTLTPVAALETAKRIGDAAIEVLIDTASAQAKLSDPSSGA